MPPAPQPRLAVQPGSPDGGVVLEVADLGGLLKPPARAWLTDHARRAAAMLASAGEVRVRVVGDAEMAAAHERYQGISGTTDVLTFDLSDAPAGAPVDVGRPSARVLDTDILICFDEASRQALARVHTTERELLLYIIHGVLHCLGHDDHDEAAAARMHAVEDRVLDALGVGATYARGGGDGGQDR
jgi:probable rRNA maturation factor